MLRMENEDHHSKGEIREVHALHLVEFDGLSSSHATAHLLIHWLRMPSS